MLQQFFPSLRAGSRISRLGGTQAAGRMDGEGEAGAAERYGANSILSNPLVLDEVCLFPAENQSDGEKTPRLARATN
jgi:hypothetical protein